MVLGKYSHQTAHYARPSRYNRFGSSVVKFAQSACIRITTEPFDLFAPGSSNPILFGLYSLFPTRGIRSMDARNVTGLPDRRHQRVTTCMPAVSARFALCRPRRNIVFATRLLLSLLRRRLDDAVLGGTLPIGAFRPACVWAGRAIPSPLDSLNQNVAR